jgi:hypothetical protein
MGVTPGQQRRPRRRAHRRGVEVGEAQPLGCQPVEHRGIGWPTEPAHVAIADVVAHDQQHIRCALGRLQRLGKLARRVLQSHLDPAPERRVRRRQHPSIRLVWRDWCAHDDGSFLPSPRRQPPRSTQRARGNPRSPADRAEGPARVIPSSRPEASGCGHRRVACQLRVRCGRSYRAGARPPLPGAPSMPSRCLPSPSHGAQ